MASYILCKATLLIIICTRYYTNYYLILITTYYIVVLPRGLMVTLNTIARNWHLMTSSLSYKHGNTATSGHIVTYVTYPSSEHSSPSTHPTAGTTTPLNFYPTTYLTLYCVKPTVRPFFCRTTREDTSPSTFIPQLIPQYIFWRRIYIVSTVIYIVRRSPMSRLKRESPKKRPTKSPPPFIVLNRYFCRLKNRQKCSSTNAELLDINPISPIPTDKNPNSTIDEPLRQKSPSSF